MALRMGRTAFLALALLLGACAPDFDTGSGVVVTPVLEHGGMLADDGMRLPVHAWLPEDKPKAVIVAVHGMNDYGMAFERPGKQWARTGIATYALDQRGFGRAGERGRWYGGGRMAEDVLVLARLARAKHPGVPVHLVGESMGGAVATLAAARAEPDLLSGVVLSAPAVWGTGLRATLTVEVAALLSNVAPDVTVPPLRVANPSTDDPAVLRRLREDPLIIHRTRLDTLAGIVDLMNEARVNARKVRAPTLVMLGDLDLHVPRDGVAALVRELPAGTTVALYPNGRHLLMRTLDGDRITADVASRVLDRKRPLPSRADLRAEACPRILLNPRGGCPETAVAANPKAPTSSQVATTPSRTVPVPPNS